MANLNITYSEMYDSAKRMSSNAEDIDTKLAECVSIVNNLVANGFTTDQASGKFEETHLEFNTAALKVMETLPQLSEWLNQAVTALQDMDTQLAGTLNH